MSDARSQFDAFVKDAVAGGLSDHEAKLINLILGDFDAIKALGTVRGRRGSHIAALIEKHGDTAPTKIDVAQLQASGGSQGIQRLQRITVKAFRGFTEEHTFEFKTPYTFVYGPNGTGKSSFCEALEFCLLGYITEANARRIDISSYAVNAYAGRMQPPVLAGLDAKAKEAKVSADARFYEFAFIERNRIDGFARISANTPAAQQERLATLFGLEEFHRFVTDFNARLEDYLDCDGKLARDLEKKRAEVAVSAKIVADTPALIAAIGEKKAALARQLGDENFDATYKRLLGTDTTSGAIAQIDTQIAKLRGIRHQPDPGITQESERVIALAKDAREYIELDREVSQYKNQLSLSGLYQEILRNQPSFPETCPACESLILNSGKLALPKHPYEHAKAMVGQLAEFAQKDARRTSLFRNIETNITSLKARLPHLQAVANNIGFKSSAKIQELVAQSGGIAAGDLVGLVKFSDYFQTQAETLGEFSHAIAEHNKTVQESAATIQKLDGERQKLQAQLNTAQTLNAEERVLNENLAKARTAITAFEAANAALIKDVELESLRVKRNRNFVDAYNSVLGRLGSYADALPARLAENLNAEALKFYNLINRHDHPSDRLKSLHLPTRQGESITIVFEGEDRSRDALHILSEGHIRCLGLAILLAKNVQNGIPLIIFDDVVNAIDDEHRRGIVETILGDSSLASKQLIVTTHGEEFVSSLENAVPKAKYKDFVTRVDFLEPKEPKKIAVKLDSARHYLEKADRAYNDGRMRDCLTESRRSMEHLMNKLWKKLGETHNTSIHVDMRAPGRPPDLMSVTQNLNKFIKEKKVEKYSGVTPHIDKIIGMDKNKREWEYLNKGVHDEARKEEFDKVLVKEIYDQLLGIDGILNG